MRQLLLTIIVAAPLLLTGCSLGLEFDDLQPQCAEGLQLVDGACVCPGDLPVSSDGKSCLCPTSYTFVPGAGRCECPAGLSDIDGVCGCAEGLVESAEGCSCPDGLDVTSDGEACQCEENFVWDPTSAACICPEPLVARDVTLQTGEERFMCGCPLNLDAEGGLFHVPQDELDVCRGMLRRVGVLGNTAMTVAQVRALQLENDNWVVAIVQESQLTTNILMFELALSPDASVSVTERGAAVSYPRPPSDGNAAAPSAVIGLSLFEFDGEVIPVIFQSDGRIIWVDYQAPTGAQVVDATHRERGTMDSEWGNLAGIFPQGIFPYNTEQWAAPSGEKIVFFAGIDLRTLNIFSPTGTTVYGFLELTFDGVSRAMNAQYVSHVLPDTPDVSNEPGLVQAGGAVFFSMNPVADQPNVILASGASGILRIATQAQPGNPDVPEGCDGSPWCFLWGDLKPALYEIEFGLPDQIVARRAEDIDPGVDFPEARQMTMDFLTAANGTAPAQMEKYFYTMFGAAGSGTDVVGIVLPAFLTCSASEELEACDFANATENGESTEVATPVYMPPITVTYRRDQDGIDIVSRQLAGSNALGGVASVLGDSLQAAPSTRLFGFMVYSLESGGTGGRSLVLADIGSGRLDAAFNYVIDPFSELPIIAPNLVAQGPFIFIETSSGVLVLHLSATSP